MNLLDVCPHCRLLVVSHCPDGSCPCELDDWCRLEEGHDGECVPMPGGPLAGYPRRPQDGTAAPMPGEVPLPLFGGEAA